MLDDLVRVRLRVRLRLRLRVRARVLDHLLPLAVDAIVEVTAPYRVELVRDVEGGEAEPQVPADLLHVQVAL